MRVGWARLVAAHIKTLRKRQRRWSAAQSESFWTDLATDAEILGGLYDFSRHKLSNWDEADAAVQETLASLSTRQTFDPKKLGDGGVEGWVYRSLNNRLNSILRKKYKDQEAAEEAADEAAQREQFRIDQETRMAAQRQLTFPEFMLDFGAQLQRLDDRTRDVVKRSLIDGQSDDEICRALKLSKGNVRVIRHRGVMTIRGFLNAAKMGEV
jgi:RNA polymerase sigma factor (sigma-70 family)